MDLRQMRYFVAVAEELHFRRAAERLNISQPPLSKQIKELELALDAVLLERTQRSVRLTPAGQVLYDGAKRILAEADALRDRVQRVERGDFGHLSVGFIPSVGFRLMPRIVRRFRETYPGITLDLAERSEVEQEEDLLQGRLDLGFARSDRTQGLLEREVILAEPLLLALPSNHPLAGEAAPDLAACRNDRFIDFRRERAPYLYDAVMRMCVDAGFVPRTAQIANSIYTCLGLVGAGVGIAILPASAMEMQTAQVVFRRPRQPAAPAEMSLWWPRSNAAPALVNFRNVSRRVAAEFSAELHEGLARLA